jgi:protoporphyrinogen oxidase
MAQDCKDMGAELRMGCEVVSCTVDGDSMVSSVTVRSDGGEESIGCDIFVSTMPLNQLAPGLLNEDGAKLLDWHALRIAAGLPYRDFLTVGLLVDKLAIENVTEGYPTFRNIPPDNWIYMQDAGVKIGRIQIFNNWSPYLLEDPENTVWLGLEYFCTEGDDFWNADDKWHLENTVDELRKIGILDDTCHTMDFHVERVKKAYPAYFDTYEELDVLVDEMRNKAKNLWCIGRNGMHNYGNMDHAMISAMLAADHIAAGDDSSANADVWEVNKDDEYHETK